MSETPEVGVDITDSTQRAAVLQIVCSGASPASVALCTQPSGDAGRNSSAYLHAAVSSEQSTHIVSETLPAQVVQGI